MTDATTSAAADESTASPSMALVKGKKPPAAKKAVAAKAVITPAAAAGPATKVAVKTAAKVAAKKTAANKVEVETEGKTVTAGADLIETLAHEVENMTTAKLYKEVQALQNSGDADLFRLGGMLAKVREGSLYMEMEVAYNDFKSYVNGECPSVGYRKADYLINIYNGLVQSGVKWSEVGHLGWTKLKEIAMVLTLENQSELVGIAESKTVLQLIDHVKALKKLAAGGNQPGEPEGEGPKITTMTFKLHEDQKETIRAALTEVKSVSGLETDTAALEHMALDYMAGTTKGAAKVQSLAEMMKTKAPEEVLTMFSEIWPDWVIEASEPGAKEEAATA